MKNQIIERHIHNEKHFSQPIIYEGINYGHIAPTDGDFVLDLKNRMWVYAEFKYRGAEVPIGQRILFEHYIENLSKLGIYGLALIVDHEFPSDQWIMAKEGVVRECLMTQTYKNRAIWVKPHKKMYLVDAIDSYMDWSMGSDEFRRDLMSNSYNPDKYHDGKYGLLS